MTDTDAPRLVAVVVPDDGAAWTAAGSGGTGASLGSTTIGPVGIRCAGAGAASGPALVFDRPHPGGATDLDGLRWLVDTAGMPTDPPGGAHPNGIDGIDHIVLMAPHLDRVRAAVVAAGLEVRRERPTRLGDAAITQLFVWAGEVLLEIVAPSDDANGGRPGDASRLWGFAFTATDLDATAAWFGDRCTAPRPAVQEGRRIATVRHQSFGLTVTIAVMSPRATTDVHRSSN